MWVSGRYEICPTCGEDVAVVLCSERFDAQDRIWTGEQQCQACGARLLYSRKAETEEERQMAKRTTKPAHRVNTVRSNGARSESREVAPARKARPRQVPLTGMEDARISKLDDVCASLAEIREQMNILRSDEAGHLRNALTLMRKHDKSSWRAAGVELARVPGEEKLRVRSTKEKATAEVEDEDHVADDGDEVEVSDDGDGAEA